MRIRCHLVLLAALVPCTWALSPSIVEDPPPVDLAGAHDPAVEHAEMEQLIGKVELRLQRMDRLLDDARAGDVSALDGVGASGIDELLKRSRSEGAGVVEDIDRILELAQHTHPGGT